MVNPRPLFADPLRRLLLVLGASGAAMVAFLLFTLLSSPDRAAAADLPMGGDTDPVAVAEEGSASVDDVAAEPVESANEVLDPQVAVVSAGLPDEFEAARAPAAPTAEVVVEAAQPVEASAAPTQDQAQRPHDAIDETAVPLADQVADVAAPVDEDAADTATALVDQVAENTAPVTEAAADTTAAVTDLAHAAAPIEVAAQVAEPAVSMVEQAAETVTPVVEPATVTAPLAEQVSETVAPIVETVAPIVETAVPTVDAAPAPVSDAATAILAGAAAPVSTMPLPIVADVVTPATAAPREVRAPINVDTPPITPAPVLDAAAPAPATTAPIREATASSVDNDEPANANEPSSTSASQPQLPSADDVRPGLVRTGAPSSTVRTGSVPTVGTPSSLVGAQPTSSRGPSLPTSIASATAHQVQPVTAEATPVANVLAPETPVATVSTAVVAGPLGAPPGGNLAPPAPAVPAAGMTGDGSSAPELGQQLATLAAVVGALLVLSQRVTADVSWRSLRVLTCLERPG